MARLVFEGAAVRKLFEHAKGCKEHVATFGMLFDKKVLKDGEKLAAGEYAKPEQVDATKVPAHLKLVKDSGVYLMSSGTPRLAGEGEKANFVAYAKGFGEDADYHMISREMGGDDFAEGLELSMFEPAMQDDALEVVLQVTARKIAVSWKPGPNAKPQETRKRPEFDKKALGRVHVAAKATRKPKWANCGQKYKGAILEIDGAVVYQLVGGGVVLHEAALLPKPIAGKGEVVEYTYPNDVNGVATLKAKQAARKSS